MNSDLTVEYWDIEKVIPYANNPRKNEAAIDSVAASIKAYGFRQPIVIDKEGVIIVGHTRYQAARRLGFVTVPVHVADLSPAEAKGYRLADNRVAEDAEWDLEELRIEIEDLNDQFTGFSEAEIEDILLDAAPDEFQDLPSGGKNPYQSITFTVHESQFEVIKQAIAKAKETDLDTSVNENSNGNAITEICLDYLK